MTILIDILAAALATIRDVLPIAVILIGFQLLVLRRTIPNLRRLAAGFVYVLVGLTLFLVGLQEALFPLGETMAEQLTSLSTSAGKPGSWHDYGWVYAFAAAIGFATTVAEPALIAVSLKAQDVSGGAVSARGLRIAVAVGVAVGVALGVFRIITGTPLPYYIIAGYAVVVLQTVRCKKEIVPLAFDSGGVTTSTVTVPIVTALGLGLASAIPGRSPLLDGFGLIAFASLFPIMSVMGYAVAVEWMGRASQRGANEEEAP
jgi:hypothetical protein